MALQQINSAKVLLAYHLRIDDDTNDAANAAASPVPIPPPPTTTTAAKTPRTPTAASPSPTSVSANTTPVAKSSNSISRTVRERSKYALLRTGNDTMNALFTMAQEELESHKIEEITDPAWNGGKGIVCSSFKIDRDTIFPNTFETSISIFMSLAEFDPARSLTSLLFKVSGFKAAISKPKDIQIIQDRTEGGSYPMATNRVVWALAASHLMSFVSSQQKDKLLRTSFHALKYTIEADRKIIYDDHEKLYRGASSTSMDAIYHDCNNTTVAESFSFSTNILHFAALKTLANIAKALGHPTEPYSTWANDLKAAIIDAFYLPSVGLFGAAKISVLGAATVVEHYELLGHALAILTGLIEPDAASQVVMRFPCTEWGYTNVWPVTSMEQQSIWPLSVCMWGLAAARVRNSAVLQQCIASVSGITLKHLSGVSCASALSGDSSCIGSNLTSVSSYLGMIVRGLFGMQTEADPQSKIKFKPLISVAMIKQFKFGERICLHSFAFQGVVIHLTLHVPHASVEATPSECECSPLPVTREIINGKPIISLNEYDGFVTVTKLSPVNAWDIYFGAAAALPKTENVDVMPQVPLSSLEVTKKATETVEEQDENDSSSSSSSSEEEINKEEKKDNNEGDEEDDELDGGWYAGNARDSNDSDQQHHQNDQPDLLHAPIVPTLLANPFEYSKPVSIVKLSSQHLVPLSPTNLEIARGPHNLLLSWKCDQEDRTFKFTIYRDGKVVASGLRQPCWQDMSSTQNSQKSITYVVSSSCEPAAAAASALPLLSSFPSNPLTFWGPSHNKRVKFVVPTRSAGGRKVDKGPVLYFGDWGLPGNLLEFANIAADYSGEYVVQIMYSNCTIGTSGIGCSVKKLRVYNRMGEQLVTTPNVIVMPQQPRSWRDFVESTGVRVKLDKTAGPFRILLDEDADIFNMSYLDHFRTFTGGAGGGTLPINNVNISLLKLNLMQCTDTEEIPSFPLTPLSTSDDEWKPEDFIPDSTSSWLLRVPNHNNQHHNNTSLSSLAPLSLSPPSSASSKASMDEPVDFTRFAAFAPIVPQSSLDQKQKY